MIRAILAFFGFHVRDVLHGPSHIEPLKAALKPRTVYTPVGAAANTNATEPTAEVDNLTERYSAARYVQALKAAMEGDYSGRGEWARHIHNMAEDDARLWWFEVDALIEHGALVHVLSDEEMEAVRQAVLDKAEEYREQSKGPALPIDPSIMHAIMQDPDAQPDDEITDAEASAWLDDVTEGENDNAEDERPEEGREEVKGQQVEG